MACFLQEALETDEHPDMLDFSDTADGLQRTNSDMTPRQNGEHEIQIRLVKHATFATIFISVLAGTHASKRQQCPKHDAVMLVYSVLSE